MPKITNPIILREATAIAERAKKAQRNLIKSDIAVLIVRSIIGKLIEKEELDPEFLGEKYKAIRQELVEQTLPYGQASNNIQNTYFEPTKLMEKVSSDSKAEDYEC